MSIHFDAGDEAPADVLKATEAGLQDAAEQLSRLIERIKAGAYSETDDVQARLRDLWKAVQAVVIGRDRFGQLCKQTAGAVGTGPLDFQSARDEIGSRLARLRDAGPG